MERKNDQRYKSISIYVLWLMVYFGFSANWEEHDQQVGDKEVWTKDMWS